MKQYKLTMNENHVDTVLRALDFYSRILCGDLNEIEAMFRLEEGKSFNETNVEMALLSLKKMIFPELSMNVTYGIAAREVSQHCKIAFDIFQAIRHKVAWNDNPKGGHTVDFDDPFVCSKEPLPEFEVVE